MPDLSQINVACIEEDPADKNLFRLQVLCNKNGIFSAGDRLNIFPDQGFLRIVPDKKEKNTFKNRLRKMLPLCTVQLSDSEDEKSKLRQNRNYSTADNEHNQFVVYSDAISALPKDLIYEVVTIPINEKISIALEDIRFSTPKGYIQRGGDWYGPFTTVPKKLYKKADRPNSQSLFTASLPNDKQHLFYFPTFENLNSSKKESEILPIGKSLQIFDKELDFDDQLASFDHSLSRNANLLKEPKKSLPPSIPIESVGSGTGTPLYARVPAASSSHKNESLNHIVISKLSSSLPSNQLPMENKPLDGTLSTLSKDSERFSAYIKELAALPNFKESYLKFLASVPLNLWEQYSVNAFSFQLETLEAERLSLVLQLQKAKENIESFTKEILLKSKSALAKEVDDLKNQLEQLEKEKEEWIRFQNTILGKVQEGSSQTSSLFYSDSPSIISQVSGQSYSFSHILHHVHFYLHNMGYNISQNQTASVLLALSQNQKIGLVHKNLSYANSFFQDVLKALCLDSFQTTRISSKERLVFPPSLLEGTPYFLLYPQITEEKAPDYCISVFFSKTADEQMTSSVYEFSPWPVLVLNFTIDYQKRFGSLSVSNLSPLSFSSLKSWGTFQNDFSNHLIPLFNQINKIPFSSAYPFLLLKNIFSFVSSACALFDGGVASALDMALSIYFVPFLIAQKNFPKQEVDALLQGFIFSSQLLKSSLS